MVVKATDQLWSGHAGSKRFKDACKACMVELVNKFGIFRVGLMFLGRYIRLRELVQMTEQKKKNLLFGIGRKATGSTPVLCARRAVFVMFPTKI